MKCKRVCRCNMATYGALAAVAVVCAHAPAAQAVVSMIPVNANVQGLGNVQIGTMRVADNEAVPGGAGAGITAKFTFAPGFGFLDDWYNFRWINVETKYTITGPHPPPAGCGTNPSSCCCGEVGRPACGAQASDPVVGTLPAIDPAPGPFPGSTKINDPAPFYFTDPEHAACMDSQVACGAICVPNVSSSWCDIKRDRRCDSVIEFATYLVVQSITDPALPPMTPCVLAGFEWKYDNLPAPGTRTQTLSIVAPGAADVARITAALGNASAPGFPGWAAMTGCTLSNCCGNNIREGSEQCDGTDDALCPGRCRADCTCPPPPALPALPGWTGVVLAGLLFVAGVFVFGKRRTETQKG